ncbi:MAG TPA: hypothetical protein VIL15_06590 [Coriobacteriia bacterium]
MEMDCIRTQATLSALHDGEHVTEESAEAARMHCDDCGACRAFEADLRKLEALPAPQAPPGLVDRVMVAVAAIVAERAEDAIAAALPLEQPVAPTDAPGSTPRFEWLSGAGRWKTFGALGAAAAAVAVIAILVTRTPTPQTASTHLPSGAQTGALDLTFSNEAATRSAAPAAPAATPAPARAPDYLTFRNRVYAPGSLLSDAKTATDAIGTVTTAFGSAGAPTQARAYRSPLTDGSIVVTGPDGTRLYAPVIRVFNSLKYQMVAGNTVDRFGQWPQLPGRFPAPTSPDGAPTFIVSGGDALGIPTYTAAGVPQMQGFAIAPGTPATDPAGSNPNWTWWEPMLIP